MAKIKPEDIRKNTRDKNYIREIVNLRALPTEGEESGKMVIEGKAVCFDEPTVLFTVDGVEYSEVIKAGAFDGADISYCFLKYNHSDHLMAMARTKNGTLKLIIKDDGVYIRAELADITAGRDLYTLVQRGDIDKMSFAFTIREESYDESLHRWTVYKIDKVYDVAAVTVPAYENTELYSRRLSDVDARIRQTVEAASLKEKRERECRKLKLKLQIMKEI